MKTSFARFRARMLTDPDVREAYDTQTSQFRLARELIAARVRARLTQQEVAVRMGTTQSAIARLEGGGRLPSFKTVARYARAVGATPVLKLVPDRQRKSNRA